MPKSKHRKNHKELSAKRKKRIQDFHKSYQNMVTKAKKLNTLSTESAENSQETLLETPESTISESVDDTLTQ